MAKFVAALKREPFFRALRCDKLILSALQTTVDIYLGGAAEASIPALALTRAGVTELRTRAEAMAVALAGAGLAARVSECKSQVGGGTLPRSAIPSAAIDMAPPGMTLSAFAARLRLGAPPVIGCLADGRLRLDLRTIFPGQDDAVIRAIRTALAPP